MRSTSARVALLSLAILGANAHAQLLDLGGGSAPVVDASTASGELAAFLEAQATEIEAIENLTGQLRAAAAIRRLAANLLTSGQSLGVSGTPRLVIARTIVTGLVPLDVALTGPDAILSHARAAIFADDCARLGVDLPREQSELDRALRDVFAPLTNAVPEPRSAWPTLDQSPTQALFTLASLAKDPQTELESQRLESLIAIDEVLTRARLWPSHRFSADRTEAIIRRAAPVLSPPAWLEPDNRVMLATAFDQTISSLAQGDRIEASLEHLEQLHSITQMINVTDAVEPVTTRRRAQARLNQFLSSFPDDPSRVARTCATLQRVLSDASDTSVFENEPRLPTFARVAWRDAVAEHAAANGRLINAVLEAMDATDPMTEPALLSAIRAERTARALLQDIVDIGAYLTGISADDTSTRGRPSVLSDRRLLASRVLEIGKQLAQVNGREEAIQRLTTIAALVHATNTQATEQSVRDDTSILTDQLHAALVDRLDRVHEDARQQLKFKEPAEPDSDAQAVIERSVRLQSFLAALQGGRVVLTVARDRLEPWAPWELTEHGWAELLDALPARLEAAAQQVIDGGEIADGDFAVIELLGLCANRLADMQPATDPVSVVLAQIALGSPPPGSFGQPDRETLAAICRDLEELASAKRRGETDRAEALQSRVALSARRIIERIETDER